MADNLLMRLNADAFQTIKYWIDLHEEDLNCEKCKMIIKSRTNKLYEVKLTIQPKEEVFEDE